MATQHFDILQTAIGPYEKYCDGYGNSNSSGNGYIVGFVVSVGKTKKNFAHPGSKLLDEINAFDLAEVSNTYIGQINMSIVSSFCGPQGLIWGYDICQIEGLHPKNKDQLQIEYEGIKVDVYSLKPLQLATQKLFGTLDNKVLPLMPGAHVPCAGKNIKIEGPGIVYSAIAMGIPYDRESNACLLMEDVGIIPDIIVQNIKNYHKIIEKKIAQSVIQIGLNQNIKFKEVFVGIEFLRAEDGEIACALVAAPYIVLARNAIIKNGNVADLTKMKMEDWQLFISD